MRLAKKLGAVVAMAAVCLTTVAPTTASAGTCPPHTFVKVVEARDSYTEHHAYLYGIVDGEDTIWKDCVITTTKIVYALNCEYCDEYISSYDRTTTVTHSACGL